MTQEDKELLLRDLSARLPHGVVYHRNDGANIKLSAIDVERGLLNYTDDIEERECKPYLRPMSSMTEEEKHNYFMTYTSIKGVDIPHPYKTQDWLNVHHFDFRNLIEKGLAIAVTEEN